MTVAQLVALADVHWPRKRTTSAPQEETGTSADLFFFAAAQK